MGLGFLLFSAFFVADCLGFLGEKGCVFRFNQAPLKILITKAV